MALSEVSEFVGAYVGIVIAALAIVVSVVGFLAITRMGKGFRTSPGKK